MGCFRILKDLLCYWRTIVIILTPLALIWIPLLYRHEANKEVRYRYTMAIYMYTQ